MGTHRGHLERIVMTFYLVHPLLLYICPVWGKDYSITLVLFNDRYQKVLNLLKKHLIIWRGNREATQYYTKSENTSAIQSKARYDSKYEHITSTGYQLMNYEPGSVFKLNGKEYVLSENYTLRRRFVVFGIPVKL